MKFDLQRIARVRSIVSICIQSGIHLEVQWILRSLNQQGDHVSRLIDTHDWQITSEFFLFLDEHWGLYTVAGLFCQFLQSQAPYIIFKIL